MPTLFIEIPKVHSYIILVSIGNIHDTILYFYTETGHDRLLLSSPRIR